MTLSESTELDPRDHKKFYYHATPFRMILVGVARGLFAPFMRLEISGLENVPLHDAVIVAANHLSNYDPFPMQFSLPRPIFFMGKASLFKFPIMDVALRNLGAFPVFRGEKDAWAIHHARRVLEHGCTLGMFPEGTRSKSRGLGVAKPGTARLALETGAPIVPMALTGTDQILRGSPRRVKVTVKFLPRIQPEAGETPLALTDRLMYMLSSALPEAMRGVYTEAPRGFRDLTLPSNT